MPMKKGMMSLAKVSDNMQDTQAFSATIAGPDGKPLQYGTPEYRAYVHQLHLEGARKAATTIIPMQRVLENHEFDWQYMQPQPARAQPEAHPLLDLLGLVRTGFPTFRGVR